MDYKDDNLWLMQGDCLERMKEIPDSSVDLVLTDPPYIGMVNEKWDRKSEEDASLMFSGFLNECYRVLRFGGRLVSFSSNDTLKWLYKSDLLHREILIVEKDMKSVAGGRNTKQYRQHINHVEYVFVATKYAREFCKEELLKAAGGMKAKDINKHLGVAENGGGMWSIYTGNNKCQQVPTKEKWEKFQSVFKDLPCFSSFEEVFNNGLSKGNVLRGYNFRFKDRSHPTQKPIDLVEYLVGIYSHENSIILDAFMGSGTTGVACKNLNRKFLGIEMDENYFNIAKDRILTE